MTTVIQASREEKRRPRVVIIGGGFAGLEAAKALHRAPVEVIVIDRTNHHLFQPLLYQVAMAALSPADITAPIRFLLRNQDNATVLMAEATAIDADRRVVCLRDEPGEVPYDYLILATGSRHSYFGHDDWETHAPGLKSLTDATGVRRRFLSAFEEAEKTSDPQERDAWMTFVLIGGGPTGCELAGVMPEIARNALRRDFRRIDTAKARVILLEAGPRILPAFDEKLAARARRDLERLGVEIRTGTPVVKIEDGLVYLEGGDTIHARTVIWAAGNVASPLARSIKGAPLDRAGRIVVEPDLSVPGRPEVFVAGDLAAIMQDGKQLPAVAQPAMQGGRAAAKNILRRIKAEPTQPFRYFDKGNMAVIGRNRAIAEIGPFKVAGFPAWLLWLFIHVLYLASFRNRLLVLMEWGYAYFTYQRGVRLIVETEAEEEKGPLPAPSPAGGEGERSRELARSR